MQFKSKLVIMGIFMTLFVLCGQGSAFAESKELLAEGTYVMGDGETPTIAEERALLQAKRSAVEQAGTYVESFSRVKNYQLTDDEVIVLASGIVEVQVVDKKRTVNGNGIEFWVKIKATVDSDKIQEMVAKVKNRENVEDYKKLQADHVRDEQVIAQLKQQLQQTTAEDGRNEIKSKLNEAEIGFSVQYWLDQGNRYELNGDYRAALNAYSKAIYLRPDYARAYFKRGEVFDKLGQHEQAFADYDRAADLDEQSTDAYNAKERIDEHRGQRQRLIRGVGMLLISGLTNRDRYIDRDRYRSRYHRQY